jgi:hypothetical protein
MIVAAALATVLSYRVVPLACTPHGLVVSGGAVLRISTRGSCANVVAGRAAAVTLDDDGSVIPQPVAATDKPASDLPPSAYALTPTSTAAPQGDEITMTIVVTIPPSTPAGSDIFLSTERSGFSPAEIRMDQLDARRYRLVIRLQEGGRLAFRVTRGTFTTIERDAKGRLPQPHIVTGHAGATFAVTVAAWGDDT